MMGVGPSSCVAYNLLGGSGVVSFPGLRPDSISQPFSPWLQYKIRGRSVSFRKSFEGGRNRSAAR